MFAKDSSLILFLLINNSWIGTGGTGSLAKDLLFLQRFMLSLSKEGGSFLKSHFGRLYRGEQSMWDNLFFSPLSQVWKLILCEMTVKIMEFFNAKVR